MQEPLSSELNEYTLTIKLQASVTVKCRCGKVLKIIHRHNVGGSEAYLVTVPPCEACLNTAISPFISEGERY